MFAANRILVPIDFSDTSAAAAKYAAALQLESQAELTLLHVATGYGPCLDASDVSLPAAYALEIAQDEAKLRAAKEKMGQFIHSHFADTPATPCVCSGDPAKVIVEQARMRKADLIVMSTHGHGGFRRLLLGSVTSKVLHDTRCPVLTISHAEHKPEADRSFRTVLCAVDYGPYSEAIVRWADEFALAVGAKLVVTHVAAMIPAGAWGYVDADASAAIHRDAEERGRMLLESTGVQAELHLRSGPVAGTLRHDVEDTNADLLVIGRHHEGGIVGRLWDTAYAIVRESPCPVVSV